MTAAPSSTVSVPAPSAGPGMTDLDFRLMGPDVARVNRGRKRLWRIAVGGVALNALIGLAGVLLQIIDETVMSASDVALYFSMMLAFSSIFIFLLMMRASRQQNADMGLLMEAFHGMIAPQVIVDPKGMRVVANRAYMAWLGNRGENVESSLFTYFGSEAAAVSELQRLAQGARNGELLTAEISHRLVTGESEWRRIVARPLSGWPGYIIWRLEDISDRRRIEENLREEQLRLSDFMAQAPVGIYSVDEAGRFIYANQTLADWLGCDPEDLIRDGVKLHEVLADAPVNTPPYAFSGGPDGEKRADLIMKGRQGRLFPVSITQTLSRSEDMIGIRTRSVVRDLTPERTYQEALSMSEQRFQRLFTDAPIGITLIDEQYRIVECNQAFVTLANATRPELIGHNFAALVHADERAAVQQYLSDVLGQTGNPRPQKFQIGGDKPRILLVYARRFFTAQTGDGGLMLHFIDVTEQEKLQFQFVQSQKMQAVGQLAGGIAHDFNNLLTAMIGFCDLLLLRHKPGDQSFSDLMQIKQNANRAANLVRQLLAFSRQQQLQPTVLNLTDEIADLTNLLRRLIGANIQLKVVHGRDLWTVKIDRVQFEQVIINMVVNARDAMKDGGQLTLRTENHTQNIPMIRGQEEMPAGEYVAISVTDTGHGIPPEIMQRIFEPFFSTKEIGAGTGLGLSTVYGIVRQTGGFIDVESDVGAGTTFTVYTPRYIETAEEAIAKVEDKGEAAADLTGAGMILLVEDEDAVRTFSSRALSNKGYNVLEARSGEEALTILSGENGGKIDLVVSDVVMPQMDGPTLIREIRKTRPELKVIFISGYTEDRLREQFEAGEVIHFLSKPFTLKQLAQKVKEVIEL